jgi:hypothetical protein
VIGLTGCRTNFVLASFTWPVVDVELLEPTEEVEDDELELPQAAGAKRVRRR